MLEAEITLQYPSSLFAKSVMKALSPDNKLADHRMEVSAFSSGKTLTVLVKYCDRIETLQATVQDIFRCIHAAESSLTKLTPRR